MNGGSIWPTTRTKTRPIDIGKAPHHFNMKDLSSLGTDATFTEADKEPFCTHEADQYKGNSLLRYHPTPVKENVNISHHPWVKKVPHGEAKHMELVPKELDQYQFVEKAPRRSSRNKRKPERLTGATQSVPIQYQESVRYALKIPSLSTNSYTIGK